MWVTIAASRVKRKAIKLYSSRSNFKVPVQAGKRAFKFSIDQMTQLKNDNNNNNTTMPRNN